MQYTAIIVRYSITLLFLWFGWQQLTDPGSWTVFLPEWTGYFPVPAETIVRVNGLAEVLAALLLAAGVYTRLVAGLLGVHLLMIAVSIGQATGVRDAALAFCTLALAAGEPDALTVDARYGKRS